MAPKQTIEPTVAVKELNDILVKANATETVTIQRGSRDQAMLLAYRTANGVTLYDPKKVLDQYLDAPERRRGTANVTTLESFIELTKRYKDADSAMFCDPTMNAASLTAVINYNRNGAEAAQRFGDHKVHYTFPYSDQWEKWNEVDGEWMMMSQFAEFIEDNVLDIIQPEQIDPNKGIAQALRALDVSPGTPEQIIALSKGMKLNVRKTFNQAIDLNSGEVQFQFDVANSNKDNMPVVAPGAFVIAIPVFRQGDPLQVGVRFRYRGPENMGDVLKFRCDLYRLDHVFDMALQEALDEAIKETELPLYLGSPEA
jgi:uncharacterized protein YfdQ (DUF2303 family)